VTKTRWSDLSERNRRLIVLGGLFDAMLRIAALFDLRRRTPDEVRGSKRTWEVLVSLVNSAGVLPLAYFVFGRRRSR